MDITLIYFLIVLGCICTVIGLFIAVDKIDNYLTSKYLKKLELQNHINKLINKK